MSTVRLPLWVWLSMVRMGSAFSLCESVVAVQDLFASSVWESEACAQSARPEQKYAPIASSMSWLKRVARDGRGRPSLHPRSMRADRPCPSGSEIFVVGIDSPRNEIAGAQKKAASRAVDRIADGVARHKFW